MEKDTIYQPSWRTASAATIRADVARLLCIVFAGTTLTGCANVFYEKTATGRFSGKLDVEWIAPNRFIYTPNPANPLAYETSDGRRIQPRAMYTDAGSIPRLFWSTSGLGPWDFAPGYIIHDWLFEQHRCKEGDWQTIDFERSASVLAEAIKTQMVKDRTSDATLLWAIHEAVSTPIARRMWDSGACSPIPASGAALAAPPPGAAAPPASVKIMTIDFN